VEHVEGRLRGVGDVALYWQGWLPAGAPRGLLLICHGMGEHSGRYTTVRDELVPDGWALYALDHRGHGRSRGTRVHVRRYAHYLADFATFHRTVAARHPDLRPFLLGQSMGGQIALAYALDHQEELAGLVLAAPALSAGDVPHAVIPLLKLLARAVPTLRYGVVDDNAVCRDEAVVAAKCADPLVHQGHPTLGLSLALAGQMATLPIRAHALRLPLLLQHGTGDRICRPDGTRTLAASVGTADLTVCWYDGFWHEIYHEPERARPLADLREWLDARR
jgi:alpha-beta hydrolase superfamily lysophospholipase